MQLGSYLKSSYQAGDGDVFFRMQEPETRECSDCGHDFTTIWKPQRLCDDCVHRRRGLDAESLRLQRAQRRMGELERIGLSGRLRTMTLNTFNRDGQPDAFDAIERLANTWPNPTIRNIALLGGRGIGKTHLVAGLLMALSDKGWPGMYCYWPSTVAAIKSTEDQREAERRLLEPLKTIDILVIDDIGRDKLTEHLEGWRDAIFDSRWVLGVPTVLVGNVTPEELKEWLGPASASRFFSECEFPAMFEVDRRQTPIKRPLTSESSHPAKPCGACAAAGWVTDPRYPIGSRDRLRRCPACNGRGW